MNAKGVETGGSFVGPDLQFVVDLAVKAGDIIKDAGKGTLEVTEKSSYSDLVTATDVAVEKMVIDAIKKAFPDHRFRAEETEREELTDCPTWIIDPIDGTSNFVHRHPDHCISIGYAEHRKVQLGVVYIPIRGELFAAQRGKGARLNSRRISVSPKRELKKSLVATGFCVGMLHSAKIEADKRQAMRDIVLHNFTALLDHTEDLRRTGSCATDLCNVACGRTDAYCEIGINDHDYAAGMLILQEAGGFVTNYEGEELQLGSRDIVAASSPELCGKLAHILKPAPFPL